ncbi:MAG: OsmC family protein [Flavobacteriaceae bacterium]|nr:OsmC family protein [Flavobacteriaceae bacterium]MBL6684871.1 OsmC family protein [Flavobacteriaceae bacterium]
MKIKLKNISGSHSIIENETGNSISIDNKSVENPKGVSPMELLLMGVAGCSSIDIISILKKQKQNFEDLIIDVVGDRENGELPALFKKIHADVRFIGNLDPQKAFRACELSFTKYCSVSKTLEATADITFSVYINNKKVLT